MCSCEAAHGTTSGRSSRGSSTPFWRSSADRGSCSSPPSYTVIALGLDALFCLLAFRAVGVTVSLLVVLYGYTLFNLSFILPSPPGQVGSNELIGLLIFSGVFRVNRTGVGAMFLFSHPWTGILMTCTGLACLSAMSLTLRGTLRLARDHEDWKDDDGPGNGSGGLPRQPRHAAPRHARRETTGAHSPRLMTRVGWHRPALTSSPPTSATAPRSGRPWRVWIASFNCAARTGPWGPAAEYQRTNVRGLETLVRAAMAAGVRRFVHVSSITVHGNNVRGASGRGLAAAHRAQSVQPVEGGRRETAAAHDPGRRRPGDDRAARVDLRAARYRELRARRRG